MKINILGTLTLLFFCLSVFTISAQTGDQEFEVSITKPDDIAGVYGWSGTSQFGGDFESNFCSNLIWAGEVETLACDPFLNDLSDQFVMIRRGVCDFSQKIINAQNAGAKAVVIITHDQDDEIGLDGTRGMGGGVMAEDVTIPAIMLSYNTGELIKAALADGEEVEICITLSSFFDPIGAYTYQTPLSQSVSLDNIQISVINRGDEAVNNVETKVEIKEPSGSITELVSVNDFPLGGEEVIVTFDSYLPAELGKYEIKFINGFTDEISMKEFEMTEFTWGTDKGEIVGSRGATDEEFAATDLFQQLGSLVIPGKDGIATHVSFGLGNAAELFTGDASSDIILIAIYNADVNADGEIDLNGDNTFEALGNPLEFGFYEITGNEGVNELLTAELDSPIMLEEGGTYYVTIAYDGINAGTGVAPQFSVSDNVEYNRILATPLQYNGDIFSGWDGNSTFVVRLHTEGFITAVEDFKILAKEKLTIFKNPISNGQLAFELQLEDVSDDVHITLRNIEGKMMKQLQYQKVSRINENIDIKGIIAGTYFLNVHTDEGFASKKIVIIK